MDDIDIIRAKAERHREQYARFDQAGFMRWIERQTPGWQEWAAGQPISILNRQRGYQTWESIQNAQRAGYTVVPPEDGPR
jgi:hypothetical protein